VRAGIVIIGNEILSGKFADENGPFLIGELRALGVELCRISVIPDQVEDIADTVSRMASRCDVVFTSGGVGPTHDDLTMEGIARGFGTTVIRHPELVALLDKYYAGEMTERHLRLADVPDGSELCYGTDPLWPVVRLDNVYILPGVPQLFRRKFLAVRDRFQAGQFHLGRVYVTSDEASIAQDLDRVVAAHPRIAFGSYLRFGEADYRVLLTVESRDRDETRRGCQALAVALGSLVVRVEEPPGGEEPE
jgi:molybdenum cofactor synthesis domain-containing protein